MASASASASTDVSPVQRAMAALGAQLHAFDTSGPSSWLRLQIRMRAAADALVAAEPDDGRRDAVLLGCQAWHELVLRDLGDDMSATIEPDALQLLQRRSERYLRLVAESPARTVRHSSQLLGSLLRAGQAGVAGGGGTSVPCVLTHGYCRHVLALLLHAARQGEAHFSLLVAEGKPDGPGHRTAAALLDAGVPVRMIEPVAVARCMAQVRLVLCGAHAVLEDGGVLGGVGTLTMAYAAAAHKRPLYIAAPHYTFCRKDHLEAAAQTTVRAAPSPSAGGRRILIERPRLDATPASLLTLLFTDVGVLTPSAVADELLQRSQ